MAFCGNCTVPITASLKRARSEEDGILWERRTGYRTLLNAYACKRGRITHEIVPVNDLSDDESPSASSWSSSPSLTDDKGFQADDTLEWPESKNSSPSHAEHSLAVSKSQSKTVAEFSCVGSNDHEEPQDETAVSQTMPRVIKVGDDKAYLVDFWNKWKGLPDNVDRDSAFKKLLQGLILPGYDYAHSTRPCPRFSFAVTPLKTAFDAASDKNRFAIENSILGIEDEYRCNVDQCQIHITAFTALGHVKTEHPHCFPPPRLTGPYECCFCSTQTADPFHFRVCPRLKRRQTYTCVACLRITRDPWNAKLHWENDSHFHGAKTGAGRKDYRATLDGWCVALPQENQWRWPKAARDPPKSAKDASKDSKAMFKGVKDKLSVTREWLLACQELDGSLST